MSATASRRRPASPPPFAPERSAAVLASNLLRVSKDRDVPLSTWLDSLASAFLGLAHERALLVARVVGDLAADVRAVESPGAPPLSVEDALDRLSALGWGDDDRVALGPGPGWD